MQQRLYMEQLVKWVIVITTKGGATKKGWKEWNYS
jgi:hypothetical protein